MALLRYSIVPLADLERYAILRAIDETKGDKELAAKLLGISKETIYRKLRVLAPETIKPRFDRSGENSARNVAKGLVWQEKALAAKAST